MQKVDIAMRNAIEKQENGTFWRGNELYIYIYMYIIVRCITMVYRCISGVFVTWNMWYTTTMIMVMVEYDIYIYTYNYITMVIVMDQ